MSTLYGDYIFESNDMAIDRLIESIETDMALFESIDILNEAEDKNIFKKAFDKIKEIIGIIRDKIKEIINKIKGKVFVKNIERKIQNANAKAKEGEAVGESVEIFNESTGFKPYKVYVIGPKFNKYTSMQLKTAENMFTKLANTPENADESEINEFRKLCESDEKAIKSVYIDGKLDIFDTKVIKSEEDSKKFLEHYKNDMLVKILKASGVNEKELKELGLSISDFNIEDMFSINVSMKDVKKYYNKDTVSNKEILSIILKTCKTELKFYKDLQAEFIKVLTNPIVDEAA